MSYPIPAIIYDPGTGNVTLNFTHPPIGKPGVMDRSTSATSIGGSGTQNGTRFDSITLSGKVQTVWYRTDKFLTLTMDYVPIASDIAKWATFIDFAMTGGQFHYHPDQTLAAFQTFTMEETDWTPQFAFFGMDKFTMKMRYVSGADGSGS
jgi:hypothetical protein